jgi:hypothetical protein
MKNQTSILTIDIFNVYALTNEEMIFIRGGGEGDPIVLGTVPPILI